MNIFLRGLGAVFFILKPCLLFSVVWLSGCAHQIAFQDLHYPIQANKYDKGIVAVIDTNTLDSTVSIHSFTTGLAHRWDARPGEKVVHCLLPLAKLKLFHEGQERTWNNLNNDGAAGLLFLTKPSQEAHSGSTQRLRWFRQEQ